MSNSAEELRQHIRNAVASLTIEEIRNICSLYSIIVRFFQKKTKNISQIITYAFIEVLKE
jgi:hypothetical protein